MYQSFMGFSGFLKNSGTLWRMRLLGVPEFYRFLWIFEIIWYTWENEALGCTRTLEGFSGFPKISGTLLRVRLLGVPEFSGFSKNLLDFSWRDGPLGEVGVIIRIVTFCSF